MLEHNVGRGSDGRSSSLIIRRPSQASEPLPRSRSKSPPYRSSRRSRSRSSQRFGSRDHPTSSSHRKPEQRMRSRSPGRRRPSPSRRSVSPRRRPSDSRRSVSPRRRPSESRRSASPRRRPSPLRRQPSPLRRRPSPLRRRPSPLRKFVSPRRRPSQDMSGSPRGVTSPGRRRHSSGRIQSPQQQSSSIGRRSRSLEKIMGWMSPPTSQRGSHLSYDEGRSRPRTDISLNEPKARSRSPIESSRQQVGSGFLSAREQSASPRRRPSDSSDTKRWQSRQERHSPRRRENLDSRNVIYDQHRRTDVPERLSLNMSTDLKPVETGLRFEKASHSHYQDSGRGLNVPLLRQTLHERFKTLDQKPLVLDENIIIGIQRNRNSIPSSTVNITEVFDALLFTMVRGREEGVKPIFDREEIKMLRHDENLSEEEFERRIIRVQPVNRLSRDSRGDNRYLESDFMEETLSRRISPHLIRKDVHRSAWPDKHLEITRQRSLSPHGKHHGATVHIRLDRGPDVKFETGVGRGRPSNKIQQKLERIQKNPNDLRHNLMQRGHFDPRMDARAKIEARRQEENQARESSRDQEGRERLGERERQFSGQRSDLRSRSNSGRGGLPDFSRRTDKYKYEEWREKPELIPKGSSYFEHDDREGFQSRSQFSRGGFVRGRGRDNKQNRDRDQGRGGYSSTFDRRESRNSYTSSRREPFPYPSNRSRGRSSFSRPYRGSRGSYRGKDYSDRGQWKHDMFDKLENSEDDKPTSTTKDI